MGFLSAAEDRNDNVEGGVIMQKAQTLPLSCRRRRQPTADGRGFLLRRNDNAKGGVIRWKVE